MTKPKPLGSILAHHFNEKIIYPLFICLLLFNNFSLASEKKIAFIDINSIFINSDAGKNLNSFLKQKKKRSR